MHSPSPPPPYTSMRVVLVVLSGKRLGEGQGQGAVFSGVVAHHWCVELYLIQTVGHSKIITTCSTSGIYAKYFKHGKSR